MMASNVIPFPNETQSGATPDDWAHFDLVLGLTADLLPVVSNRDAIISPNSSLKEKGKVPSIYNSQHQVVGLPNWTTKQATPQDIYNWSQHPDYGICIQTRNIRAIDVDVPDADKAAQLAEFLEVAGLPARRRTNSGKFLLAFQMPGAHAKRKMVVDGGIIEFLGNGQQFIAVGTHPSGVPYQWQGSLPADVPTLTLDQFNRLWASLASTFAIEAPTSGNLSERKKGPHLRLQDDLADYLYANDFALDERPDGSIILQCPWEAEHTTGQTGDTSTLYFPAGTNGYERGHFKCLHGHCEGRTDSDFIQAIGYGLDDFEELAEEPAKPLRYQFVNAVDFAKSKPLEYLIKGVLPKANLIMLYGPSGSGKTFFVFDMAAAIARGIPWRGLKTIKGRVAYICAEGSGGFKSRIQAYNLHNGLDSLDIQVLAESPSFMKMDDVRDLNAALKTLAPLALVIVDTFAQVMPGANENAGEDISRALENCKAINRVTDAPVLLVHHTGKDEAKGARGWSGIKGAVDAEITIERSDEDRCATISKLKDGPEGAEYPFKLHSVTLGVDADGDAITSMVVAHHTGPTRVDMRPEPKGAAELAVLTTLRGMQELDLECRVKVAHLIDSAVEQLLFDPASGRRDRRRDVVMRAIEKLSMEKRLEVVGQFVDLT